ncbi:PQ loop repeat-domain-containing protein [Epithele typhae]|uniref:PQ loop repeat-domain-containing protein n=1 Tax=Epithele typhae TaxID=378194 RepID=UPI002007D05D|nr:PQ loop repeat-domain-containing protein [Epithele typhae]KAH9940866.1 PQ loop repeat-domain-containing protein [Epithele typhae]
MPTNAAAENVLGTIGTICWTVQLVPQIWHTYRTKSVDGLSEYLVLMWGIAGAFLGPYSIVQNLNIPLILQPQLFAALCFVSWAQCQYYGHKRSKTASIAMWLVAISVFAGFEAGMVFALRPSARNGNLAPVRAFGIISTIILSLSFVDLQVKEVIGISLLFMGVDLLGGVFNVLSLVFKGDFDVVAGITYSLVVLLDGLVLLAAFILNPLAKRRRSRAARAEAQAASEKKEPDTSEVEKGSA